MWVLVYRSISFLFTYWELPSPPDRTRWDCSSQRSSVGAGGELWPYHTVTWRNLTHSAQLVVDEPVHLLELAIEEVLDFGTKHLLP